MTSITSSLFKLWTQMTLKVVSFQQSLGTKLEEYGRTNGNTEIVRRDFAFWKKTWGSVPNFKHITSELRKIFELNNLTFLHWRLTWRKSFSHNSCRDFFEITFARGGSWCIHVTSHLCESSASRLVALAESLCKIPNEGISALKRRTRRKNCARCGFSRTEKNEKPPEKKPWP